MILLSKRIDQTNVTRIKAPRNFMYEIDDIHFTVLSSGNNNVAVLDYLLEDEVVQLDIANINAIAIIHTNVTVIQDFGFKTGIKTKFISIAPDTGTAFALFIVISGKLVPATRTELLIEWFRKGR